MKQPSSNGDILPTFTPADRPIPNQKMLDDVCVVNNSAIE